MTEEITLDEYRTGYIAEKYSVSDNTARALQLFELGYTISGTAKRLPVTESTVRSYHKRLQDEIHPNVVLTLTETSQKFDVWGDRDPARYSEYGYDEGVRDARESEGHVTQSEDEVEPELRDGSRPRNKGTELVNIESDVLEKATL
jgi:hypothetical protein